MANQPILVDRRRSARLRRDGFVTVDAIDPTQAADLRDAYLSLRGREGRGFVPDLIVDDLGYRRTASEILAEGLDDVAAGLFVDHRPFLRNFLCKHPGDDSALYLHQDWTYVDERTGARTYIVWVALEDIDGPNGQLRVLRGSHHIDRDLRGSNLVAPWMRHEDVLRDRLLTVPLRAGQAIVFDNALVHCSYPNHTGELRLSAAIGMRPAEAALVYFRRADDRGAHRYDIDDEFFLQILPQVLLEEPPDRPVADRPQRSRAVPTPRPPTPRQAGPTSSSRPVGAVEPELSASGGV